MPRTRPSFGEMAEFAEATLLLAAASAAIRLLPFRGLVRTMGSADPAGRERGSASDVRRAVHRAAARLPWRTVCFQQGLAAHWMLRRRGHPSRLHYGIRPEQAALKAHVWITLDDEFVVGEVAPGQEHAEVAVFPMR